jgi:hypothetical protein
VEVHVSLVGRKDLTGEIYRQLRRAILDGRLPPGGRLPPTRELARRLSVSRTTVTVAYDRLVGEGFLATRVGAGTFVGNGLEAATRPTRRTGGALRPWPIWDTIAVPVVFEHPAEFDFRPGIPDGRLFPYQTWRRLLARELRADAVGGGGYGDPAGHPGLREAIARHIGIARGVQATAEDVVVTNGTQQAVDIVARVLLAPGDPHPTRSGVGLWRHSHRASRRGTAPAPPMLRRLSPRRQLAEAGGTHRVDRDAHQHAALVLHGAAVLVPVGMLPADAAVVVDQPVHRRRQRHHPRRPLDLQPAAEEAVGEDAQDRGRVTPQVPRLVGAFPGRDDEHPLAVHPDQDR